MGCIFWMLQLVLHSLWNCLIKLLEDLYSSLHTTNTLLEQVGALSSCHDVTADRAILRFSFRGTFLLGILKNNQNSHFDVYWEWIKNLMNSFDEVRIDIPFWCSTTSSLLTPFHSFKAFWSWLLKKDLVEIDLLVC